MVLLDDTAIRVAGNFHPAVPEKSRAKSISTSALSSVPRLSLLFLFLIDISILIFNSELYPPPHGLATGSCLSSAPSMPFSATPHASSAQAQLGTRDPPMNIGSDYVMQSRETGEVVPPPTEKSIRGADKPEPKPFAHFIAGGYVERDRWLAGCR